VFSRLQAQTLVVCFAEIGQAEPPEDEPKQAFERLITFMKQHLAA
jgi:adenosyl cobinamide kinase/adenosyl cobinamide phosphate guanylyltransferase